MGIKYIDLSFIKSIFATSIFVVLFGFITYEFSQQDNEYNFYFMIILTYLITILIIIVLIWSFPLIITNDYIVVSGIYSDRLKLKLKRIYREDIKLIKYEKRDSYWGNLPYAIIELNDGTEYFISELRLRNKKYRDIFTQYYPSFSNNMTYNKIDETSNINVIRFRRNHINKIITIIIILGLIIPMPLIYLITYDVLLTSSYILIYSIFLVLSLAFTLIFIGDLKWPDYFQILENGIFMRNKNLPNEYNISWEDIDYIRIFGLLNVIIVYPEVGFRFEYDMNFTKKRSPRLMFKISTDEMNYLIENAPVITK